MIGKIVTFWRVKVQIWIIYCILLVIECCGTLGTAVNEAYFALFSMGAHGTGMTPYAINLHRIVIMTNLVSFSFSQSILHSYHNRQYKRTDKERGRNSNNNNKHFCARIYLWHGERKRRVFDWKEIWSSRQGKIKIYFIFLYISGKMIYHSCLGDND